MIPRGRPPPRPTMQGRGEGMDWQDWTRDAKTGRSNSSDEYVFLVGVVARLMRNDYRLGDDPERTAGLIVAQLAHKYHLAPTEPITDTE